MTNLLAETIEDIEHAGQSPDDIVFIGSRTSGHSCTWAEFQILANVDYHSGYGTAEVAGDLEIIFRDGTTMSRGEYDGSEWWEIHRPFVAPATLHPIARLTSTDGGYEGSLAEIDKTVRDAGVSR